MQAFVVSSFPRSGNTWARFFLATAILGRRPTSLELDQSTPDAHLPLPPVEAWIKDPGLILKSHFEPGALARYLKSFANRMACALFISRGIRLTWRFQSNNL